MSRAFASARKSYISLDNGAPYETYRLQQIGIKPIIVSAKSVWLFVD